MTAIIAYALHNIMRKPEEVEPGTVFEMPIAEYNELLALNAVRSATSDEIALYDMAHARAAEPQISASREQLEATARAAGIKFNKNISDETLAERIAAAKVAADPDVLDKSAATDTGVLQTANLADL